MAVREGILVFFAKGAEGDQTTVKCMVTVARDGETCISCKTLTDNMLLRGEVRQHRAGLACACVFSLFPAVECRTMFLPRLVPNVISVLLCRQEPAPLVLHLLDQEVVSWPSRHSRACSAITMYNTSG